VVSETSRLVLRPMAEDDLGDLFRIFSDRNVLSAFGLDSITSEQMKRWLDRNLKHQREHGYGLFSVVLKSNGELIGNCGLEHTEFEGRPCVELGYDFLSCYWNRGYATEAAGAVRDLAVRELRIEHDSICSFIRRSGKASQRVSEKIGMRRVKEYRRHDTEYFLYAYSEKLAGIEGS